MNTERWTPSVTPESICSLYWRKAPVDKKHDLSYARVQHVIKVKDFYKIENLGG